MPGFPGLGFLGRGGLTPLGCSLEGPDGGTGAVLSSSLGGGCHEADAREEECGQSPPGAWAREGELGLELETLGTQEESHWEAMLCWLPDSFAFYLLW